MSRTRCAGLLSTFALTLAVSLGTSVKVAGAQHAGTPRSMARFASAVQSSAAIQVVVRKHRRAIMSFYQHQLKMHPDIQGTIKVRLSVAENGHVAKIETLSDSVKNRPLAANIKKRAGAWEFGTLDQRQVVDLTFPFAPV